MGSLPGGNINDHNLRLSFPLGIFEVPHPPGAMVRRLLAQPPSRCLGRWVNHDFLALRAMRSSARHVIHSLRDWRRQDCRQVVSDTDVRVMYRLGLFYLHSAKSRLGFGFGVCYLFVGVHVCPKH